MNTVDIYIEEKSFVFTKEIDKYLKTSGNENCMIGDCTDEVSILNSFKRLLNSKNEKKIIFPGKISKNLKIFSSCFRQIEAAGGLIQNKKKKFLFIFRLGKWDLPKGKIDKGEAIRKAAIRECEEECAVNKLKIVEKIPPTYHMYQLKGEWVLKKTHWFLMKTSFDGKLIPQTEEGITKVEWSDNFSKVRKNTFPSVLEVLKSVEKA